MEKAHTQLRLYIIRSVQLQLCPFLNMEASIHSFVNAESILSMHPPRPSYREDACPQPSPSDVDASNASYHHRFANSPRHASQWNFIRLLDTTKLYSLNKLTTFVIPHVMTHGAETRGWVNRAVPLCHATTSTYMERTINVPHSSFCMPSAKNV